MFCWFSGTKTTSKTVCWLGEKLLPRWRVPVSQRPINMSSSSRKELYKMAVVSRTGSGDSGNGCVSLGSTDWARKGSTCRLAKTNTAQRWQRGSHWGTAEPPQSCSLSKDCCRKSETRACGFPPSSLVHSSSFQWLMANRVPRFHIPSLMEPNLLGATALPTASSSWEA